MTTSTRTNLDDPEFLVLPSFGKHGATVGQRAVRLARVRRDGRPPGARVVIALLTGGTGYFLFVGLASVVPVFGVFAFLVVAGASCWRGHDRTAGCPDRPPVCPLWIRAGSSRNRPDTRPSRH